MEEEPSHWDFEEVKNSARDVWNKELSRFEIEGAYC